MENNGKKEIRNAGPDTPEASGTPVGIRYVTQTVKSALPLWIAAATWLVCALILPFHRIWAVLLTALLSAGAALLAKRLLPEESRQVAVPFASGNIELDAMVNELDRVRGLIENDRAAVEEKFPEAARKMAGINGTIGLIRDDVASQPEDLRLIRRFMNYYLPVTVKMTDKYVFLSKQDDSAGVRETRDAAEKALDVIGSAFSKQYDALFANDSLDITTDVKVLEAMIKRDRLD